jgi:hypothetical protein
MGVGCGSTGFPGELALFDLDELERAKEWAAS